MNYKEAAEKAKNYLKERKLDCYLIEAYLELQSYPAWSNHDNFDEELNIGVKNVLKIEQELDIGYIRGEVEFIKCEFNGINFMVGGASKYSDDDDGLDYQGVSLFIDEKRVLAVRYIIKKHPAYSPSDYSISSVEEFHSNVKIQSLLSGLHDAIVKKKTRDKERMETKKADSYKGKFTFDE